MKKIAVVLSGCGNKDGSEITEAVSTLISLAELKTNYEIFAPDRDVQTTDYLTGQPGEKRNVLREAARIARGQIQDLKTLNPKSFDALVFPGGMGAATVLCEFAKTGAECKVLPEVQSAIEGFYNLKKPIGAICIAPTLIARVLGTKGIHVTIGDDPGTSEEIKKTGAHHERCAVEGHVTDREHKIVTTPAYMQKNARPDQVFAGIRGAMKDLVDLI